ncbi:MAG TPA: hypothetical protein VGN61_03935, partial [Verrucomicrobiae bacterium]
MVEVAANLVPSADDAILHIAVCRPVGAQFTPELVELQTPSYPAATNIVPSADEAIDVQPFVAEALVCIQSTPSSLEVQIPSERATAANLVPSADNAIDHQFSVGALVWIQ